MNKSAMATILGTAALGLMKKNSGSFAKEPVYSLMGIEKVLEFANDPEKAPLVKGVKLHRDVFSESNSLPPEIFKFKNLEKLDLSYCSLSSLSPKIGLLKNLKILDLKNNNITVIPPEIGNLTNLRILLLDYNKLNTLPPEIGKLQNLFSLHLMNNNITSLPKEFGNLTKLIDLYLSSDVEALFIDGGNLISMPSPKVLQFWMNNLTPEAMKEVSEFIESNPSSQLRRF